MSSAELGFIVVAAIVAAVVKSISGLGYPLLLVPVLALFMDISDAVMTAGFSNLALNAVLLWQSREQRHESATLKPFLFAAILGGAVGALLLPILPERALRIFLVLIVVLFLFNRWRSPSFTIPPDKALRYARPVGFVAGVMQGAAGISGPVVTPWFLSVGLTRNAFVVSINTAFAVSGSAQIVVLGLRGVYSRDLLIAALLLIPIAVTMVPIGVRLRDKISGVMFDRLVLGLLAVSALTILIRLF